SHALVAGAQRGRRAPRRRAAVPLRRGAVRPRRGRRPAGAEHPLMRALRASHAQIVLDRAAPEPSPAPGWAIIRPTRVGVRTEDGVANADRVLGAEFVGVVERVEPDPDRGLPESDKKWK